MGVFGSWFAITTALCGFKCGLTFFPGNEGGWRRGVREASAEVLPGKRVFCRVFLGARIVVVVGVFSVLTPLEAGDGSAAFPDVAAPVASALARVSADPHVRGQLLQFSKLLSSISSCSSAAALLLKVRDLR